MSFDPADRTLLSGWGRFPTHRSLVHHPRSLDDASKLLSHRRGSTFIPRGLGRSYGDSALADQVVQTSYLDHFLSFDHNTGILKCGAGVTLSEILRVFLPRGWFLQVTPGTRFVTIGGAIASDVHGKNHHLIGTFSESVLSMDVLLATGEIVTCTRSSYADLFHATCGGMGLTGIILTATVQLQPVQSCLVEQTTFKTATLQETLELFQSEQNHPYSVAWIDCLAPSRRLGRSLLMIGRHSAQGWGCSERRYPAFHIPIDLPSFTLNRWSVKLFNEIHYRIGKTGLSANVDIDSFFYPLDRVGSWNRIYGKRGFTQYQFVIPTEAGEEGLTRILKMITNTGEGSFLAVLKLFGPENDNLLSFPMEGYTLALDFRMNNRTLKLMSELDAVILDYGGRLYLAKDARMSAHMFHKTYPKATDFRAIREKYGAVGKFESLQSKRLEI